MRNQLADIRKMLEATEIHGRIQCHIIYEDRVIVYANGTYYGILDLVRKTWVD